MRMFVIVVALFVLLGSSELALAVVDVRPFDGSCGSARASFARVPIGAKKCSPTTAALGLDLTR